MEVIDCTQKKINKEIIRRTAQVLKRGGVIIYPTDTCYGLGCDPEHKKAVNRIFQIKKRAKTMPLLLVASSRIMILRYAIFTPRAVAASKRFWPGPLTMVLPSRKNIKLSKYLVKNHKIAFRIPNDIFLIQLIRKFKKPIVATSANISGKQPPYDGDRLVKIFSRAKEKPDLVINVGRLPKRKTSTVAEFNRIIKILRPGAVKL